MKKGKKKKLLRKIIPITMTFIICATMVYIYKPYESKEANVSIGSSGSDVANIQTKLKKWGYYNGSADGNYGTQTRNAVIAFQKKNNITADGIVGPQTAQALGVTLSSQGKSVATNDIYLLAKCVYAEARGEPYLGRVAVAAVILNRVKNANFPNTVAGVVYQPLAFTAVADGQINLSPDNESIKAAQDALNGWDPTNGCLYYYNPVKATSKWIYTRTVMLVIGKHRFAL